MESTPLKEGLVSFENNTHIDSSSYLLNTILIPLSKTIQDELNTVQSLAESFQRSDKDTLLKFKASLELFQKYVDLTIKLLQAQSENNIQNVKDGLRALSSTDSRINSKEDLNPVMLGYLLEYVKEKFFPKVHVLLEDISRLKNNKEKPPKPEDMQDKIDWITIMTFRLDLVNDSYLNTATYSKSDIFSFPKTSQTWEDLKKHMVFKRISTSEEIEKEVNKIFVGIKAFYAVLRQRSLRTDNPKFPGPFSFIKQSIQFHKNPARGEALFQLFFINPNQEAFRVLRFTDDPWIVRLGSLRNKKIAYEKYIYVPRLYPAITTDLLNQEIQENTLNKLHPMPIDEANKTSKDRSNRIFSKSQNSIGIRILASERLNLQKNFGEKVGSFFHSVKNMCSRTQINAEAIIIHFHGGGYVSGTSNSHKNFLTRWVNNLQMVHFSVDYRTAPNQYPDALDDVWQAYLWIVNNATSLLGIQYKKVIVIGDSAGATLATGLTLRLIRAGLRVPDGCLLIYPSFSRITDLSSPSHLISLDDPIISFHLHRLLTKAYIPKEYEPINDPCVRPLYASDELLERMPPVRIVIGTRDLLYDNSVRFLYRLRVLNKDAKMVVFEDLPHAFYNLADLKAYDQINNQTCDVIRELVSL